MCRLLGVVSRTSSPLPDLLGGSLAPFTALAEEHNDGWGVAYQDGAGVAAVRSLAAAHVSADFTETLHGIRSRAAFAHIRMANPGSPIVMANTHPFVSGPLAFCHNGDFAPTEALDQLIEPPLLAQRDGTTDSERLFLLIRSYARRSDLPTAIRLAAEDVRLRAARYSAINCLLLTPAALYAYADVDPDSEVARRRGTDYFALRINIEPNQILVGSTGWDQPTPAWRTMSWRTVAEISVTDLRVRYPLTNHLLDIRGSSRRGPVAT
jgi:predicted glutamine amidotransferase